MSLASLVPVPAAILGLRPLSMSSISTYCAPSGLPAAELVRQKSSELSALPDRYCGAQCTECTSDLAGEEASTDVIPWPANLVFPKAPAGHVARHWASATGELRAPAVRICVAVDTANVRAPADSHRGISSRRRRREAAGSNASGLARRRCEFACNVNAGTVQIGIA